jgi:hypothetical protein
MDATQRGGSAVEATHVAILTKTNFVFLIIAVCLLLRFILRNHVNIIISVAQQWRDKKLITNVIVYFTVHN